MFDEPEMHIISFPDLGDEQQAEREQQRREGRRRYLDDLAGFLADRGSPGLDPRGWAEAILDHLFVTLRRDGDGVCPCSCHPRLPETDLHGYGFDCTCRLSPDERRERFAAWTADMDIYRDSPEGRAEVAARQAEEDELIAWLVSQPDVVVTSHGGWAPEQWWGSVDGHSFYFRERHDEWRIEVDLQPCGRFSRVWRGGDLDDDRNFEAKELEEGSVIAEGTISVDGYGRNPTERIAFIVGTIRDHLRRQRCRAHTAGLADLERRVGHQLAWCPACGTRL